jgi:hypothetical protein
VSASGFVQGQTSSALEQGFQNPPNSAKPRVWWHWINGNITKDGARLDLEWMKRVGIGGVTIVEASIDSPQVLNKPLLYMSPGWKDAFKYATSVADKLGIEVSIDTSPGWSETGGPWVRPEQAMKKLVWSKTLVEGGRHFVGQLMLPPTVTGPFQDVGFVRREASAITVKEPEFYADARVVAYRLPSNQSAQVNCTITSSAGPIDAAPVQDGNLHQGLSLPAESGNAWVQFAYDNPRTIRSAVLGTPLPNSEVWGNLVPPVLSGQLEYQDEHGTWTTIGTLNITNVPEVTVSFKPVTAKVFRVNLSLPTPQKPVIPLWMDTSILDKYGPAAPKDISLSELSLETVGRVNEFERKAGFALMDDYYAIPTPSEAANAPVSKSDVLDLTGKMTAQGLLDWNPPPGEWVVLRLGFSLLGTTNASAPPEATGLEVDKLNRSDVQEYMNSYLNSYSSFLPSSLIGQHGLQALLSDSTEVGPQNWTDDIIDQFRHLRGYDPAPWLPTLTGAIVESAEASDKFLWDFRRTLSELLATNHYAQVALSAHARGLKQYGEAIENKRQAFGDDVEMRRYADIPTGAMWQFPVYVDPFSPYLDKGPQPTFIGDDRGAASVAHLYGQNLAAAESFTVVGPVPWAFGPRDLKPVADLEFVLGVNRILVHSSVHQAIEKAPGITLGPVGQYFNRHETWAEQAGPWMSYLARSSYMLQQGRFAADVAYFYGEEAPLTILQDQGRLNDVPNAYGFDFVNADAVLNLLDVRNSYLFTPSGMRYRVLQLGGTSTRMTVPVLHKLRNLVQKGAIVVGPAPIESPSLADDPVDFDRLRNEMWGSDGKGASLGNGRVLGRRSVEEALAEEGVSPDLTYSRSRSDTELMYVHRILSDGDIYFLTNRRNQQETLEVSFRVSNKAPELWHAENGTTEPVSFRIENGRTVVPLKLEPYDAVFVVFRKPALTATRIIPEQVSETLTVLNGPWDVTFQSGLGAPSSAIINQLESWSNSSNPGVKYFSGTATYTKNIEAPATWFRSGNRLLLDLGKVEQLAEVSVNGKSLGIVWKQPYEVDLTSVLHSSKNILQVKVTNLWVNRLIGDQQPGATKYTFTTAPFTYTQSAPLQPSGLLGPITVIRQNTPALDQLKRPTSSFRSRRLTVPQAGPL